MKKKSTLLLICLCASISLLAFDPGYLTIISTGKPVAVRNYSTVSPGWGNPVMALSFSETLTITKTSDKAIYPLNAIATFTVTISNSGGSLVRIDKITDEIPAGFTYQGLHNSSGVTPANSLSLPAVGSTGTITFEGTISSTGDTSFAVPAGGSIVLRYTAVAPNYEAFYLVTSANGYEGTKLVGPAQHTVSVSNTLPVTLISINATWLSETVKLSWSTMNEAGSGVTEIERSTGTGAFVKIGEIPATGSSATQQSYSFIDAFPAIGANKYRLKLTDLDGHYKYSPIILLTKKQSGVMLLNSFPNPLAGELNVQVTSDKNQSVELRLTDITGRTVMTRNENCVQGTTTVILNNLSGLREGTYLLQVITPGSSREQKLVKRNF